MGRRDITLKASSPRKKNIVQQTHSHRLIFKTLQSQTLNCLLVLPIPPIYTPPETQKQEDLISPSHSQNRVRLPAYLPTYLPTYPPQNPLSKVPTPTSPSISVLLLSTLLFTTLASATSNVFTYTCTCSGCACNSQQQQQQQQITITGATRHLQLLFYRVVRTH